MINIKSLGHDALDCFEQSIMSLASYWKCDYEMMCFGSWDFEFDKIFQDFSSYKKQFENKIIWYWKEKFKTNWENLEKHHGIKLFFHEQNKPGVAIERIDVELSKKTPALIVVDDFWCRWIGSQYGINHGLHSCLVVGINKEKNILQCLDPYYSDSIKDLLFEDFNNAFIGYVSFDVLRVGNSSILFMDIIDKIIINAERSNVIYEIKKFSEMDGLIGLLDEENISRQNYAYSILFRFFTHIILNRKKFSIAFNYLVNRYELKYFAGISKKFRDVGFGWEIIRALIKQMFSSNKRDRAFTEISRRINEMAIKEEDILNELKGIHKEGFDMKKNKFVNDHHINKITVDFNDMEIFKLDIKKYFNNKGFSNMQLSDQSEGLDGLGQFFYNINQTDGKLLDFMHSVFFSPWKNKTTLDNISCDGQLINIKGGKYNIISILGCAEFGNFSDNITIIYDEGEDVMPIEFTDWFKLYPAFDEKIAWTGKVCRRNDDGFKILPNDANLYYQIYHINHEKKITGISLPVCPNIHIFSISFLRMKINKKGRKK